MKIIALLNEKGGTGKATLSQNIAVSLHRQGKRVILVDADPRGLPATGALPVLKMPIFPT